MKMKKMLLMLLVMTAMVSACGKLAPPDRPDKATYPRTYPKD